MRGIPTPGLDGPARSLTTYYGRDLAHELLASAATSESSQRWITLRDASAPVIEKDPSQAERDRAVREVQRRCIEEGLTGDTGWSDVIDLGCRMAQELAHERPRLDSYQLADGAPAEAREPYAEYPRAIGLALNMLPGLRNGWEQPGPAFIRRWGTEATYADELESVLASC